MARAARYAGPGSRTDGFLSIVLSYLFSVDGQSRGKTEKQEEWRGGFIGGFSGLYSINGCLFISLHVATILVFFLFIVSTLNFDLVQKTGYDKCL